MYRLVIVSLAFGLMQGCIIIDDTEELCGERADGVCFGITADCPTDAVSFTAIIQPVGATGSFPGTFNCGSGGAVLVDPGTYDVRVEATDGTGEVVFGSEPVLAQEVADLDDVLLDFEFPDDQGFFWLNWVIQDAAEAEITCDDAGAAELEVEATPVVGGTATTDVLPCQYTGWQTRGLELGEYELVVALVDGEGTAILTSEPIQAELTAASELVALPTQIFVP